MPFTKPEYWTSYSEFVRVIEEMGGSAYFVREQHTFLGNGKFSNSWQIRDGVIVNTGPITADVIFDKGRFASDNMVPVFNDPRVADFCLDKWEMYRQLKKFCPFTVYVENQAELTSALPQISTKSVVFKPVKGAEGIGVKIELREVFESPEVALDFPALVSEFLDTSSGIPGIVAGVHDLRVALFDGEIMYSYVRTPPSGSLLANVALGGDWEMIAISRLPPEVVQIVMEVDQRFSDIPHRFYGVDFGYTKDGPKIIEMNAELGLDMNEDDPIFLTVKERLARVLLELAGAA